MKWSLMLGSILSFPAFATAWYETNFFQSLNHIDNSHELIVAVIDSGVNINLPNLRVWENTDEIPNNGIDDDYNGYVDDMVGWNFLGARNGHATYDPTDLKIIEQNKQLQLKASTLTITREYLDLSNRANLTVADKRRLQYLERHIKNKLERAHKLANQYKRERFIFEQAAEKISLRPRHITQIDLAPNAQDSPEQELAKSFLSDKLIQGIDYNFILSEIELFETQIYYHYNLALNQRERLIGDDPLRLVEQGYGNNDVIATDALHGTRVAHLISKLAPNTVIMPLRALPNGAERDKDVINAIYYAIENGADIINISFGKYYSPHKKDVFDALLAAQRAGILVVLAAGNDGKDLSQTPSYPSKVMAEQVLSDILVVGASNKSGQRANFSNYGLLDILAPGVALTDFKGNKIHGTSFSAPLVSAAAAIMKGFDHDLDPHEIISILKEGADYHPEQQQGVLNPLNSLRILKN